MRKIKSVKLRHDYWDEFTYVQQGTELTRAKLNYWYLNETRTINENDIISNKSKIFEIEYEPEGFELKRYTEYGFLDYDSFMKRELNRLADWCDGQSRQDITRHMVTYSESAKYLNTGSYTRGMIHHGLKFISNDSASLFITELDKPENSEYKNYFIELLKKTRL